MSAITAALGKIDEIGAEGELDANGPTRSASTSMGCRPDRAARRQADLPAAAVRRANRRGGMQADRHQGSGGQPVPSVDRAPRGWEEPGRQSAGVQAVARARPGGNRTPRQPVLRAGRDAARPGSDELFFRYDFVPAGERGGEVRLVDSAFVEAMRRGWLVMVDEVNTARDMACCRSTGPRRPARAVSARDGRDGRRPARVRRAARVQPRAGRRHRHP